MRAYRLFSLSLVLAVFGGFSQIAIAQSVYGSIKGTLTDISGKPIAGAKVTVSSVGKGTKYRTITDGSGFYAAYDVSPDDYSLRIEAAGFKTFQNPQVTVYADSTTSVNPKLVSGSATEVVVGSAADVSVLKIDRTDVATILSQRQIEDLPLAQQNVSNLQILAPGAIPVKPTLPRVQNPQQGAYINVNGQIFSGTAYQLDGTDNRDPIEGLVIINPNQEAVGELKITTQNYSSEFGQATAGVVTAQTKSGANALHGSLFGYRQTGWGQASDPNLFTEVTTSTGTSIVPPEIGHTTFKKNQFGGSIGGPIIKNRLFFFGDYRGTRDSSGATLTLTVPTAEVRNTCLGPTGAVGTPDCDLSEYGVPLTGPSADPVNPMQLLNTHVSPQMVYLLSLLPGPTNGCTTPPCPVTNNFQATGTEPFNSDNSDLRLDYNASQKLKLFARYSYDSFRQDGSPAYGIAGGPGTNPDLFAGNAKTLNQSLSSGFSYSFGDSLLTDFRFGFLRYHLDMNAPDFGTYPVANPSSAYANDGIVGLNCTGNPCTPDIFSSGLPDIQITSSNLLGGNVPPVTTLGDFVEYGYSSNLNSCNCPLREHEGQFQFVNNWTKLAGHHAFRWGADFRYIQNFRLSSSGGGSTSRAGHLQFSDGTGGAGTGFGVGDFLVGFLSSFDRTYSDPTQNPSAYNAQEHQKRAFFYGEDTWRVSSRFTVNYGLRWEVYFPQTVNADAGGFLLIQNDTLPNFSNVPINVAGSSGVNLQGNVQNTFKNFGPRVGFAYLAGKAKKTVIRGGYGRSFDVGYEGSLFGIAATQNPPIAAHFVIRNGSSSGLVLNDPTATSANPLDISSYTDFTVTSSPLTAQGLCSVQLANGGSVGSPAAPCLPGNLAADGSPLTGTALYALPTRLRVPTVDSWNLTIQRELTPDAYFELAYVGNKGTHVLTDTTPYYNLNVPAPPAASQITLFPAAPNTHACSRLYTPASTTPNYCVPVTAAQSPLTPSIDPIYYFGNNASDNYNSLQAKFSKRFSGGFSTLAHYVYSKALDYDSSYFAINPGIGYGPSSFDRRHSFAMANTWSLPIGRGRALMGGINNVGDKIVGGWSLQAITSWFSGLPFSPVYGECNADLSSSSLATPPCRPNIVGQVQVTKNRSEYFTTTGGAPLAASGTIPGVVTERCGFDPTTMTLQTGPAIGPWQRPGCGQYGNAGRNSLRGPQFFQSDIALMKEIPIAERVALRFRADVFNAFNNVNLGLPNNQVDAATQAGAITTVAPGATQRQWEFSARLQF